MLMYSMCMEIRTRGGKIRVRLNFCAQVVMEFLAPRILVATLAANTGIDNHHVLAVLQSSKGVSAGSSYIFPGARMSML